MNTAILFDMDGVVLDTEPLYTNAEIKLFNEYGVTIPKKDIHIFRGCSEEDFYNLSIKRYNIKENKEIFVAKGRKYVKEEFAKGPPFMPGFKNLIDRIQKIYITGLVTASPVENVRWLCKKIHLDQYFKNIISGSECSNNKPHPEPYLKMMKYLNVRPERCIIIEDSILGITSALSSGAYVIAKTGSVPIYKLSIAHHIVHHLDEITNKLLDSILSKRI